MHEIGMLEQCAKTVTQVARDNGIDMVQSVTIELGELSGALPEIFTEYFPIIAKEYPALDGTELKLDIIPCRALCRDCSAVFRVAQHEGKCPRCGSLNKKILGGTDIIIKQIEC